MNEKVTISLNREDWREIAKFLSKKCGEAVNIMPIISLLAEMGKNGFTAAEMRENGFTTAEMGAAQ